MNRQQIIDEVTRLAHEGSPNLLSQTVQLLRDNCEGWNWVGIYFLGGDVLHLGPYAGKSTEHTRIKVGAGVCGSAVADDTNIIVDDVTKRENYLACTLETRSEIVVLIRDKGRGRGRGKGKGKVVGQFDIDSDKPANFSQADEQFLEKLAEIVSSSCAREASVMKIG